MDAQTMKEMYDGGKSIYTISQDFNMSYQRIRKILVENGVRIRNQNVNRLSESTKEMIASDLKTATSYAFIAKKYNVNIASVRYIAEVKNLYIPREKMKRIRSNEKTKELEEHYSFKEYNIKRRQRGNVFDIELWKPKQCRHIGDNNEACNEEIALRSYCLRHASECYTKVEVKPRIAKKR